MRETFPTMSDDLTVAEAADALGTTPQTVRRLLRHGELRGRRQPWEAGSSGFRVGTVSASSFRSRGAWMDAAGAGRRPASSVGSRTSRRRVHPPRLVRARPTPA